METYGVSGAGKGVWTARCLDINFREDDCRIRQGDAAENSSRLNRLALNLLQAERTNAVGIKTKRLCCA